MHNGQSKKVLPRRSYAGKSRAEFRKNFGQRCREINRASGRVWYAMQLNRELRRSDSGQGET